MTVSADLATRHGTLRRYFLKIDGVQYVLNQRVAGPDGSDAPISDGAWVGSRVLLGSMPGIFRWQTGDGSCAAVVGGAALDFNDVYSADGEVWFLAQDAAGLGGPGHLYRYTWSTGALDDLGVIGTVDLDPDASAVLALSATRCLVGYGNPGGGAANYGMREYNAGAETDHTVFDAECRAIFRDSGGNCYAAVYDNGNVYQWPGSGTAWTKIADGPNDGAAVEMGGVSASAIWQCGSNAGKGRIWFWNGATWATQWTDARASSGVTGLHALAANDVWACNLLGEILHFDGTTWSAVYTDATADFYDVRAISATEVYAVADKAGASLLYMLSGGAWSTVVADAGSASSYSLFATSDPAAVVGLNCLRVPDVEYAHDLGVKTLSIAPSSMTFELDDVEDPDG